MASPAQGHGLLEFSRRIELVTLLLNASVREAAVEAVGDIPASLLHLPGRSGSTPLPPYFVLKKRHIQPHSDMNKAWAGGDHVYKHQTYFHAEKCQRHCWTPETCEVSCGGRCFPCRKPEITGESGSHASAPPGRRREAGIVQHPNKQQQFVFP